MSKSSASSVLFDSPFKKPVRVEFDGVAQSSDGGLLLLKGVSERWCNPATPAWDALPRQGGTHMTSKDKRTTTDLLSDELVDKLLEGYTKPQDLIGEGGILKQLTARLVERVLDAEMTAHLGYEKHEAVGDKSGNSRNGSRKKKLITDRGPLEVATPRDREGASNPSWSRSTSAVLTASTT